MIELGANLDLAAAGNQPRSRQDEETAAGEGDRGRSAVLIVDSHSTEPGLGAARGRAAVATAAGGPAALGLVVVVLTRVRRCGEAHEGKGGNREDRQPLERVHYNYLPFGMDTTNCTLLLSAFGVEMRMRSVESEISISNVLRGDHFEPGHRACCCEPDERGDGRRMLLGPADQRELRGRSRRLERA